LSVLRLQIADGEPAETTEVADRGPRPDLRGRGAQVGSKLATNGAAGAAREALYVRVDGPHGTLDPQPLGEGQPLRHSEPPVRQSSSEGGAGSSGIGRARIGVTAAAIACQAAEPSRSAAYPSAVGR